MTQPGTQTETQRISRRSFTVAAVGVLGASYASNTLGQDKSGSSTTPPQDAEAQPARGPIEAEFERDYQEPSFKPRWAKPQINRAMAQDFVIFAHSDLEMTKQLLDREPGILNATIDWGAGDFESGLGGASHMGRKDIVELLLGRGARIDIFCAAMLGMLPAIKAMLEMEPALIDAKGPHGFSLHFHAQVGQADAKPVLDYLQSIKEVELRPVPFLQGRGNKSDG